MVKVDNFRYEARGLVDDDSEVVDGQLPFRKDSNHVELSGIFVALWRRLDAKRFAHAATGLAEGDLITAHTRMIAHASDIQKRGSPPRVATPPKSTPTAPR